MLSGVGVTSFEPNYNGMKSFRKIDSYGCTMYKVFEIALIFHSTKETARQWKKLMYIKTFKFSGFELLSGLKSLNLI